MFVNYNCTCVNLNYCKVYFTAPLKCHYIFAHLNFKLQMILGPLSRHLPVRVLSCHFLRSFVRVTKSTVLSLFVAQSGIARHERGGGKLTLVLLEESVESGREAHVGPGRETGRWDFFMPRSGMGEGKGVVGNSSARKSHASALALLDTVSF